MTTQEEFLSGGTSYPAIKPEGLGEMIKGIILEEPQIVRRENLNDKQLEDQLVINLDVAGEKRTLWVRKGFMSSAIGEAVKKAGATGLAEGGELAVVWTENRDTGKPQPARVYAAQYKPPTTSGVDVDAIFNQ